jgi:microcystin-dependent protein
MSLTRYFRNYFKQTVPSKDRFRTGDDPSQTNFDKLFDSVGMIKDPDDKATNSEQGFTRTATDAEAIGRAVTAADDLAMSVTPHQIPSYESSDSTIGITESTLSLGGGKSRKKIDITNLMTVTEDNPGTQPVIVTQSAAGKNVVIGWDDDLLPTKGKVMPDSTEDPQYLIDALESRDGSIDIALSPPAVTSPNKKVNLQIVKFGMTKQITMWYGTAAEMATQFPGGYCTTGEWTGWAIADGGTYNSVVTPDLRALFPVGYDATDYPNIGTVNYKKDSASVQGQKEVTLTAAQSGVPAHTHTITDPGHTHSYSNYPPQANDTYAPTTPDNLSLNDTPTAATSGSNTTGISVNNSVAAAASTAHENRPPFFTVLFLMYVGV